MEGIEPASGWLIAAYLYQHGSHRNQVRTAGFEPAISCSRSTRNTRLSYVLSERPAGVELALPPWRGSRLPLHHGRVFMGRIVKDREHQEGLEPSSPHYGCGVLAAGRPVLVIPVGPEGLEPSPSGLRVRCAATSTLIPCRFSQSARKESNLRPDPYKRPALTVELRAASVGPEGLEPSPDGLKVRYASITPRPPAWSGVCVSSGLVSTASCSCSPPVVALRVELSATCSSDRFGQPALGYQDTNAVIDPVGMVGLEPTVSCSQGTRAGRCPTSRRFQSERPDLNRRSPAPRAGAIPRLRHVLHLQQLVRESNPLLHLERAQS